MFFISVLLTFLVSNSSASIQSEELSPFKTDLCTFFKEGTRDKPNLWAHCCIKHDLAYWVAGRKVMQSRADKELRKCVKEVASPFIANLMYRGVRLGHLSPFKSPYKWGWGRAGDRRKYEKLTKEEIAETIVSLQYLNELDPLLIREFIEFRFPINTSF